jgi:hypothetical protein
MKLQTPLFTGLLVFTSACVVRSPATLDAGDETGTSDDADPYPGPTDGDSCTAALDILVVLDNSGTMAGAQRLLAEAVPALIDGLDQASVDWRLAITTTDNGNNQWCSGSTPKSGSFVLSSCKGRINDFDFGSEDQRDLGCNDICDLSAAEIEILPTTTSLDATAQARPWLQREGGQLNLAAGIDLGDAIRCVVPQGVNGCGFEQPLEAMNLALSHATSSNRP